MREAPAVLEEEGEGRDEQAVESVLVVERDGPLSAMKDSKSHVFIQRKTYLLRRIRPSLLLVRRKVRRELMVGKVHHGLDALNLCVNTSSSARRRSSEEESTKRVFRGNVVPGIGIQLNFSRSVLS